MGHLTWHAAGKLPLKKPNSPRSKNFHQSDTNHLPHQSPKVPAPRQRSHPPPIQLQIKVNAGEHNPNRLPEGTKHRSWLACSQETNVKPPPGCKKTTSARHKQPLPNRRRIPSQTVKAKLNRPPPTRKPKERRTSSNNDGISNCSYKARAASEHPCAPLSMQ